MNVNLNSPWRFASLLLLSLALGGCASSPWAPSPEVAQRIESARTRADHEALAAHFDGETAKARAVAAEHRTMASSYKRFQGLAAAKWAGYSMPAHCETIVRSQEDIAAAYEAMASAHRQIAQQTQP